MPYTGLEFQPNLTVRKLVYRTEPYTITNQIGSSSSIAEILNLVLHLGHSTIICVESLKNVEISSSGEKSAPSICARHARFHFAAAGIVIFGACTFFAAAAFYPARNFASKLLEARKIIQNVPVLNFLSRPIPVRDRLIKKTIKQLVIYLLSIEG